MFPSKSPSDSSSPRIHLVCGALGAGKSTYAQRLAVANNAVRFATDDWMQELFGPDRPTPMSWPWAVERVLRCERRILSVALQILRTGGDVVLELGLMKVADRQRVLAEVSGGDHGVEIHWIETSDDVRRARVAARNTVHGETYAFEVSPAMFDMVERLYEPPTTEELQHAKVIDGN